MACQPWRRLLNKVCHPWRFNEGEAQKRSLARRWRFNEGGAQKPVRHHCRLKRGGAQNFVHLQMGGDQRLVRHQLKFVIGGAQNLVHQ
jgi:hypothetical protein